jgi:hypothetical protein
MPDLYYNNKSQRYKICAGAGCLNKSIVLLKVRYINKNGHFCQKCSNDLLQSDLAEKIFVDDTNE